MSSNTIEAYCTPDIELEFSRTDPLVDWVAKATPYLWVIDGLEQKHYGKFCFGIDKTMANLIPFDTYWFLTHFSFLFIDFMAETDVPHVIKNRDKKYLPNDSIPGSTIGQDKSTFKIKLREDDERGESWFIGTETILFRLVFEAMKCNL